VGDPLGMAITHAVASGMGGMRAAGDLVARMQIARGMKIDQAKQYVADKLTVSVADLTDPIIMNEVRDDLNPHGGSPRCMEAKFNIATLLDIDINCVNRFKQKASL
jgi:dimethylamine--corrinoid protein Co-methyltransferase